MIAKITEYSYIAEVGKRGEYFNFSVRLDLEDPGFKEQFFKKREQALKKYLEMKRRIISNVSQKVS